MLQIYHGSTTIIEKPVFGCGNRNNDYGLGFYCSYSLDLAREWSVRRRHDGYANCYEIECEGLDILDLNQPGYSILHWLALLLRNREFDIPAIIALEAKEYLVENFSFPYEQYDAIIGYRADDSYFSFAQDFINNGISYRHLNNAMRLCGQQFVLKSREAFDRLKFVGSEAVRSDKWYHRRRQRDQAVLNEYLYGEQHGRRNSDIYIKDIIDEEIAADDPRL